MLEEVAILEGLRRDATAASALAKVVREVGDDVSVETFARLVSKGTSDGQRSSPNLNAKKSPQVSERVVMRSHEAAAR